MLVLGFATLSIFQCVDCFVYFSPLYVLYHGALLDSNKKSYSAGCFWRICNEVAKLEFQFWTRWNVIETVNGFTWQCTCILMYTLHYCNHT